MATMRPRLKIGVIPTQNLPLRPFDKEVNKEARSKRSLSRAVAQAQQSSWVQSLLNSDMEPLLSASSAPSAGQEEATTSGDGSIMEINGTLGNYLCDCSGLEGL